MEALTAREKILNSSLELFSKKGYKGTTTKQIANDAGVSELTIFRQFGNKEGILRHLFESKFQYESNFFESFQTQLQYDLVPDLVNAAFYFQEKLSENIRIIMIILNEFDSFSDISDLYLKMPTSVKSFFIDYFNEMKKRGILSVENPELAAVTFMSMNIGFMIMGRTFGEHLTLVTKEEFINGSIRSFAEQLANGN